MCGVNPSASIDVEVREVTPHFIPLRWSPSRNLELDWQGTGPAVSSSVSRPSQCWGYRHSDHTCFLCGFCRFESGPRFVQPMLFLAKLACFTAISYCIALTGLALTV